QLRVGLRVHRLQLVDGALRPRDAQHAQLREITRQSGLRRLDALVAQLLRQLVLRGDLVIAQHLADGVLPLLLREAADVLQRPHAEIHEPTPLSVKSSPMIECGTRPSSKCTLGTPDASTFKMLRAFAIMPPEM